MAGLTVAAVAVPQAMAYAQIAGIPPQYGLYTAIVMTAVGALLDSSKQLINGPTNAISIAVLSALVGFSDAERIPAVILLALMVGVIQTGISLLRLGDLTRYVSHAVIVGFTLGAAVLLVLDQLKNLLGLPGRRTGEDHFLKRVWLTLSHIGQTNQTALVDRIGNRRHCARAALGQHAAAHSAARSFAGNHLHDGRGRELASRQAGRENRRRHTGQFAVV